MNTIPENILKSKLFAWRSVRCVFGAILIVAAFLKWRDFGTSNALFDIAPSLEFGLIQLEVLMAFWLEIGFSLVLHSLVVRRFCRCLVGDGHAEEGFLWMFRECRYPACVGVLD